MLISGFLQDNHSTYNHNAEYGAYMLSNFVIVVKSLAHLINLLMISFCGPVSIVEVTTKCFSSLLISGVGKSLYTVSFSAMRIILKFTYIKVRRHAKTYLKLSATLHLMR